MRIQGWWNWWKIAPAGCVLAGVASAACSGSARSSDTSAPRDEPAALMPGDHALPIEPMTVTGCLQRGERSFIVTGINSPAGPPVGTSGTSGTSADASRVARDHLREAAHAYALAGDDNWFETFVGKQVRVVATVAEVAELHAPGAKADRQRRREPVAVGGSGDIERATIRERDLMKLEVASIEPVASSCGHPSTVPRR